LDHTPGDVIVAFIDSHRDACEVEPICRVLQTAPSWGYTLKARATDPRRLPARAKRDVQVSPAIARVWRANRGDSYDNTLVEAIIGLFKTEATCLPPSLKRNFTTPIWTVPSWYSNDMVSFKHGSIQALKRE
jgi:hypothetical protein